MLIRTLFEVCKFMFYIIFMQNKILKFGSETAAYENVIADFIIDVYLSDDTY